MVSAVGAGQFVVTRASDGAALTTTPFTALVPQVTMSVSNGAGVNGTVVVTLAPDKTPITVGNFLSYVNAGFYDGTVIHRVSPGFVIQGGGYVAPVSTDTPTAKPTSPPIGLEVNKGLSNAQWTIAMARTSDPASATSQFFINLVTTAQRWIQSDQWRGLCSVRFRDRGNHHRHRHRGRTMHRDSVLSPQRRVHADAERGHHIGRADAVSATRR